MKKILAIFASLLGLHSNSQAESARLGSVDVAIKALSNKPVDQTVIEIAQLLAKGDVVIPSPKTDINGSTAQFLTGLDNEGHVWLYIYSESQKLPEGTPIFIMTFQDLKNIIASNSQFGGIYINASYPVPRELFGKFFSVAK